RDRIRAFYLMGDQRLPVLLGQLTQGGGDRPALLAAERLLFWEDRLAQVDEPMGMAPAAVLARRQRPGEVPGRHHGVGREGPWLKASADRHDPRERLLHQVLDDVAVMDPGADHPSQQRDELNDVVILELPGGLTSAQPN